MPKEATRPFPLLWEDWDPPIPDNMKLMLEDVPAYGKGLLPWIKLVAILLLPGRDPRQVAHIIHLAIKDQNFPIAELRVLKSNNSTTFL